MKTEKTLITLNKFFQYIPVVSTLTSAVNAAIKYIFVEKKGEYQGHNLYYRHLHELSGVRLVVLSIPVIGNIVVGLIDLSKKKKPEVEVPENVNFVDEDDEIFASEKIVANDKANAEREFHQLDKRSKQDRDVVLTFVKRNGILLQFAPEALWGDAEIVQAAFENDPSSIQFAVGEAKKEIQESLDPSDSRYFYARVPDRKAPKNVAGEDIPEEKWWNRDFVLDRVQRRGSDLRHANEEFKWDREIVLAAVTNDGNALRHAQKMFLDDEEIVKIAMQTEASVYHIASEKVQAIPEIRALF